MYKLGDIYPDWKNLERLPNCIFEELKKSHGVTEETLFVVGGGSFPKGTIVKFSRDDGSAAPLFTDGKGEYYKAISFLAILPQDSKKTTKFRRVWTENKRLESNDGIVIEDGKIKYDGMEMDRSELKAHAKKLAKELGKARSALIMIGK